MRSAWKCLSVARQVSQAFIFSFGLLRDQGFLSKGSQRSLPFSIADQNLRRNRNYSGESSVSQWLMSKIKKNSPNVLMVPTSENNTWQMFPA